MRVNISYSVKLDDVPKTVGNLINESKDKLFLPTNEKIENVLKLISQDNQKKAIELIDEIRKDLAQADVRLLDCSSILEGYQQAVLNMNNTAKSES